MCGALLKCLKYHVGRTLRIYPRYFFTKNHVWRTFKIFQRYFERLKNIPFKISQRNFEKNLENITCDTLLKYFKDILKKLENITRGAPFKIPQRYFEKNENILKIF